MSDIVKRLRDVEAWCHVSTAKEAADEIERLRALQPEGKVEAVAKAELEIRITEHNQYVIGQLHFNDPRAAIGWLAIYRPADVEKAKEVFAAALLPVGQTRGEIIEECARVAEQAEHYRESAAKAIRSLASPQGKAP